MSCKRLMFITIQSPMLWYKKCATLNMVAQLRSDERLYAFKGFHPCAVMSNS